MMKGPLAPAAFVLACLVAAAPDAGAQGSDSCSTPSVLAGAGPYAFNNATATQGAEGQAYAICTAFGSTVVNHDVWFTWVAPQTSTFAISFCGTTTVDTKIAVYEANVCPTAAPLACNDDSCGLRSMAVFPAQVGHVYTFQVGTYPSGIGGTGTFSVEPTSSPTCGSTTGPDVIVGDIQDVDNQTAAAGIDSISLGTTSCNVGTATLQWQASTSLHPVIGGTLYRYRVQGGSGRFEQIGMSWLKHGFVAEAGSVCCTCVSPGSSALLGVGCSDPYGASLNGTQVSLGPRWQVNPHTGVFPMPHANPPFSGNTARRLEFALADIDTTAGVRYFGECNYVTPDDAAANNQNNNASCRELTVSGTATNYTFALAASTKRGQAAIRMWPALEPGVTLTDVQVPGDGLFVVGSRATDIGGGFWHYEFAVYDQNADRAGGAFRVPVPAGANVQNIGFHDVAYRDGDGPGDVNFSGTDWAVAQGAGVIAWSCETQVQNASANALRWGTTYGFRFDADVGPMPGSVYLDLWKPGAPGSMNVSASVPSNGGRTGFVFCTGDGPATPCPCANFAVFGSGTGCANSLGVGGRLGTSGTASVSNDTFVLDGSLMPNGPALYFRGTTQLNGGAGVAFGDGLQCAGGVLTRLGIKANTAGASAFPETGDFALSTGVAAGEVQEFQCWYRDSANYCTPDGFNFTNALQQTWAP